MNPLERKIISREDLELVYAVSNTVNSMIVILDCQGRIVRLNQACIKVAAMPLHKAQGQYFWNIFCQPDEKELCKAFFLALNPKDLPHKFEAQMIDGEGNLREILWEQYQLGLREEDVAAYIMNGNDLTVQKNSYRSLEETKEMYRMLIHASPVAVISLTDELHVKGWSSAAETLTGWSEKETLGKHVSAFLDQWENELTAYAAKSLTGNSFYHVEHSCAKKDGSIITVEFSLAPIRNCRGEVNGLILVINDISERKKYETELLYKTYHDQLTGLYNRLYFEQELKKLQKENKYPVTMISADLDGLKLFNDTLGYEKGDQMLVKCSQLIKKALRSTDMMARVGGDEFAIILPATEQPEGTVIAERIKAAFYSYNLSKRSLPLSLSLGLTTASDEKRPLVELFREADDLMYMDKLQTGSGAKSQIIKSLIAALTERDLYTADHAFRLETHCRKLGAKMSLAHKNLGRLFLLAQMHDLGKVGIPDYILFKKGPLSEEEWNLMRKHPEKGHRIASASPDLFGIADLILKHHERWDGKGYPLGLKRKEIPIECRILSVIDAFDAMTNERPYKKARSIQDAVSEVRRCSGTQFDPEVVEYFITILQESYLFE